MQRPLQNTENSFSRKELNENNVKQLHYTGNKSSDTDYSGSSLSDRSFDSCNFKEYSRDWSKQSVFGFNGLHTNAAEPLHFQNYQSMQYFKRPLTLISEYYLKRLYNYNAPSNVENPSNLIRQSQWDGVSVQIWDKYVTFRQSNATYCQKINIYSELYELLQRFPLFQHRAFSNWSLHLVGSTISGFGVDSSDVDICLYMKSKPSQYLDPRAEAVATLNEIRNFLVESSTTSSFRDFYLINAKVPILRLYDSTSKFIKFLYF
jgi:hypothetical protein